MDTSSAPGAGTYWTDARPLINGLIDALNAGKMEWRGSVTPSQRDALAAPALGDVVYNSTTSQFEAYDGSAWGALGGGGSMTGAEVETLLDAYYGGTAWRTQDGYEANTDSQTLSLAGADLSISGGNTVTLPSGGGSTETGLVAGTTQTQLGASQTAATYSRFTEVANSGDGGRTHLSPTSGVGHVILNAGANPMAFYPASGDRFGSLSVDQAVTIPAGAYLALRAVGDGTNWDYALSSEPIEVSQISATGSPTASTYLRGDGSWASPSSGGGSTATIGDAMPAFSAAGFYGARASDAFRYYETANSYFDLATGVYTDGDAPTLSGVSGAATGDSTADLAATTDEANGTLYWFVSTSGTAPSATDLKAGTGAAFAASEAVASTGQKAETATGLAASTDYYLHALHADAAANDSAIVSSSLFSTTSGSAYLIDEGAEGVGLPVASWTEIGDVNWDESTAPAPLDGAESIALTTSFDAVVVDLGSEYSELWGYVLIYQVSSFGANDNIIFKNSLDVEQANIRLNNDRIVADHGVATDQKLGFAATDNVLELWWHYVADTGATDGVLEVFYNIGASGGRPPADPSVSVGTGGDISSIRFTNENTAGVMFVDRVVVSQTEITGTP